MVNDNEIDVDEDKVIDNVENLSKSAKKKKKKKAKAGMI